MVNTAECKGYTTNHRLKDDFREIDKLCDGMQNLNLNLDGNQGELKESKFPIIGEQRRRDIELGNFENMDDGQSTEEVREAVKADLEW